MTHATKRAPRLAAISAAMAAMLLAGCSTGHIGESWQCPLAEGGTCDSVAAADPAVPDPKAAGTAVLAEPLWRVRGDELAGGSAETPCATACGEGFDPFAWLARLFGGGDPDSSAGSGGEASADRAGPGDAMAAAGPSTSNPSAPGDAIRKAEPAASSTSPAGTEPQPADPAAALLPAPGSREPVPASEPGGQAPEPAPYDREAGDLRTDEVVARIWIAPFVDADGVYREASHVRVVLDPAGWRLK